MVELNVHWTEQSTEDFLYRISSDYISQLERMMDEGRISQKKLAKALGVTEGRVSQVLNNPGNMTLKKVIQYARALGRKAAIVAYDDNDPANERGPINAEIFSACWDRLGKPSDFFALREATEGYAANTLLLEAHPGKRGGPELYQTKITNASNATTQSFNFAQAGNMSFVGEPLWQNQTK